MSTLLFLGDSITDCNHYFEPENLGFGYVRMISDKMNAPDRNYQVLNKGNDGFTVSRVHQMWKRSCKDLHPDFITILIGINDLAVIKNTGKTITVELSEFCSSYQSLITEIRRTAHCPILLMEPFIFPQPAEYRLWEEDLQMISKIIQDIAVKNELHFLPLWEMFCDAANKKGTSALTTDGIHLTSYGHSLLADAWLQFPKNLSL